MLVLLGKFIKSLNIEMIAFVGIALFGAVATFLYWQASKDLKAAEAETALERHKRLQAEEQLVDAQEKFDSRLNDIAALERNRKTNRLELQPLARRIDELSGEIPDAPQSTLVDRLNGLNFDLNRMLEHNSR